MDKISLFQTDFSYHAISSKGSTITCNMVVENIMKAKIAKKYDILQVHRYLKSLFAHKNFHFQCIKYHYCKKTFHNMKYLRKAPAIT